jgi:hypothetical protein
MEPPMDGLTAGVRIAEAYAWPVATLIIVLILRRPVEVFLKRARKIKYGEFEMNVESAAYISADGSGQTATSNAGLAIPAEVAHSAEVSPRAVVIESWQKVSAAAVAAVAKEGIRLPRGSIAPKVIEESLEGIGLLSKNQIELLRTLRLQRNAAVHAAAFKMTPGEAIEYSGKAQNLAQSIAEKSKIRGK